MTINDLKDIIHCQLLGNGFWAQQARNQGKRHPAIDRYLVEAAVSASPGVNDDPARLLVVIQMGEAVRQAIIEIAGGLQEPVPPPAQFALTEERWDDMQNGRPIALPALEVSCWPTLEKMAFSIVQSIGLESSDETGLDAFISGLSALCQEKRVGDGAWQPHVDAAEAHLAQAKIKRFGEPSFQPLETATLLKPCLVLTGCDFLILEEVLVQTFQRGIHVYTHGALKSAHAYPGFRQFNHLKGHVNILPEGETCVLALGFDPALLNDSNHCFFTTGLIGLPEVRHVTDPGYREVIACAIR
jgi:hydroxylamine reductase